VHVVALVFAVHVQDSLFCPSHAAQYVKVLWGMLLGERIWSHLSSMCAKIMSVHIDRHLEIPVFVTSGVLGGI
jgi:hypothetical protein